MLSSNASRALARPTAQGNSAGRITAGGNAAPARQASIVISTGNVSAAVVTPTALGNSAETTAVVDPAVTARQHSFATQTACVPPSAIRPALERNAVTTDAGGVVGPALRVTHALSTEFVSKESLLLPTAPLTLSHPGRT